MANEFIIRKGYKSLAASEVTGSLQITGATTSGGNLTAPKLIMGNTQLYKSGDNNHIHFIGTALIGTSTTASSNPKIGTSTYPFSQVHAGYYYGDGSNLTNVTATNYTETDTLGSVTGRGATTTNAITTGDVTISSATPELFFADTDNNTDAKLLANNGNVGIFSDINQEYSDSIIYFNIDGTERARFDGTGYHFRPGTDSTYDLGLNATRWRNVYADTYYGDGSNLTGISTDNFYLTGLSFNTGNGVLTATVDGASNPTVDLDGRYPTFQTHRLQLSNGEISNFNGSMQMIIDANDGDSNITNYGDYAGSYPFGIYFTGDNDASTTTLGSGLVKVWHTGHFKKGHIDYLHAISSSLVTSTEFGYLDGVTSNIQTQLNAKLESESDTLDTVVERGAVTDNNITVNSLLTNTDSTYTIGTNSTRFSDGYFDNLHVKAEIANNTAAYINYRSNQGHRFYVDANGDDTTHTFQILANTSTYDANNVIFTMEQTGDAEFTGDVTVAGTLTAQEFHTEFVSASILYESGSTKFGDTSDDNHDFTGSINLLSGSLNITGPFSDPGTPLTLHNSTNAAGVGIRFTDTQAGTSQYGRLVYRHSDSQSQGGGASFHFTAEPDTVLVVGDSTNKGRFAAYSSNNAAEVDYGFAGDTNTGLYQVAAGSLGLVRDGSRKLLVNGDGVRIQNGRFYLDGTVDTNTSSTSALVLNGTEVEQRTLGSNAFNSTAFLTSESDTLDSVTGRGSTTTNTITVGPSATNGGRILSQTYSGTNRLGVISSHNSSGNIMIGYGLEGKSGSSGYVSTYGNFSGRHGALEIYGAGFKFVGDTSNSTTSIGSDITTTTFFNLNSGNLTLSGDLTVSGGDITLSGTGRIQGIDTVSSNTDAANKLYVDNSVPTDFVSKANGGTFSGNIVVTGSITSTNVIYTDEIRDRTGQDLTITAGEASGHLTQATHNDEVIRLAAESGVKVYSSTDNLTSGLNKVTTLIDSSGHMSIAGDLTVEGGDISLSGTGRIQGIDTVSSNTDAANKLYVDNAIAGVGGVSAPNAPTSLTTSIVGNTINVGFTASTTSDIDLYLVFSSVSGSDYSLISVIPPDDFGSTMSIIDDSFDESGVQAYRVYAQKNGAMSSALTGNITYSVTTPLEPTNMSVVNLNTAYYVQWDPPSSNARFVTAYNVYKHEHATQSSLSRSSATLIYSGMNTSYMYQINGNNNLNYHQFWVETTVA